MIAAIPLENLTGADFAPYLHSAFNVQLAAGESYALELDQVNELGEAPQPGLRRPFALLFRNPGRTAYLPQRIYRLEHPRAGTLELFLTPLGPDEQGMRYEAIFS